MRASIKRALILMYCISSVSGLVGTPLSAAPPAPEASELPRDFLGVWSPDTNRCENTADGDILYVTPRAMLEGDTTYVLKASQVPSVSTSGDQRLVAQFRIINGSLIRDDKIDLRIDNGDNRLKAVFAGDSDDRTFYYYRCFQ